MTRVDPPNLPTLKLEFPHRKGEPVKLLQRRLTVHGFEIGDDGVLGHGTVSELRKFQEAKGLAVNGICGPETWDLLLADKEK